MCPLWGEGLGSATVTDADELLPAAMAGDRVALAAFVRETQADVWRYCAHVGGGDETADLVQETYARALRALHRYRGQSSARTWLLAIARRVCADSIRVARRRRLIEALFTRDDVDNDPNEHVALAELVRQLSHDRRDAFVLTQIIGTPYAEAARICQVPLGTIRSRVARARHDLHVRVDQATG